MAGSNTNRFGSSAEGTDLQLPVMGDPLQYINPMYTQAPQMDNSMSPLAAFQQYKQSGVLPQQQSQFQPFTPPTMPSMFINTAAQNPSRFASLFDFSGQSQAPREYSFSDSGNRDSGGN